MSGVSDLDHVGITRLLGRYADTVTRRAWDELDDLFLSDATVHIDTVTRPAFTVTGPADVVKELRERAAHTASVAKMPEPQKAEHNGAGQPLRRLACGARGADIASTSGSTPRGRAGQPR